MKVTGTNLRIDKELGITPSNIQDLKKIAEQMKNSDRIKIKIESLSIENHGDAFKEIYTVTFKKISQPGIDRLINHIKTLKKSAIEQNSFKENLRSTNEKLILNIKNLFLGGNEKDIALLSSNSISKEKFISTLQDAVFQKIEFNNIKNHFELIENIKI